MSQSTSKNKTVVNLVCSGKYEIASKYRKMLCAIFSLDKQKTRILNLSSKKLQKFIRVLKLIKVEKIQLAI